MGSGLSMTSVNKIKELAEAREYSLAVEILDSQNLEASLNPQFLRICGEVYENVGRYRDARNMYVKAHAMGPESGRIIFSLIRFYLKLGYRKLAELYREQYIASVHGSEQEIRKLSYVMEKAGRAPLSELRGYLDPWYIHDMDEEWSFELFLINFMDGQDTEMLASDYCATFKRSRRSEQVRDVLQGRLSAEKLFYIYAEEEREDKDPEEEEIRALISELHLEEKVPLLGFKTGQDLKDVVANAHCVCMPSECCENAPYSIMEAQAAGRPAIVSRNGGLPELVTDGITGYVFTPNDVDDLAEKIRMMDAASWDGEQIVEMAREKYSAENYVRKLMHYYKKLIEWKKRGR